MVALDEVDGMKSSVETYRTCTDKENTRTTVCQNHQEKIVQVSDIMVLSF